MSDVLHLQASDALLMQATFYATALKREREFREGQVQLLEQLRRQLGERGRRDQVLEKLVTRVGEFITARSRKDEGFQIEAYYERAIEAVVEAYCELEEHDEKARGIDREEEVEAYRNA